VASFDAGSVVEALDYTFEPFVPGCKGTIKEPTSVQLQAFLTANAKEMQRLRREAGDDAAGGAADPTAGNEAGDGAPPDDAVLASAVSDKLLARIAETDPKKVEAAKLRQAKIFSALCSGEPSAADLLKLPHRQMSAFANWITDELMNPEAVTGDGTPHLQIVRSSAAG
jgi:hypothetical protein